MFKVCIWETNALLWMAFTHTSSALAISAAIKSLMCDLHNFLHMSINLRTTAVTLDSLLKELYHVNSAALDIPADCTDWEALTNECTINTGVFTNSLSDALASNEIWRSGHASGNVMRKGSPFYQKSLFGNISPLHPHNGISARLKFPGPNFQFSEQDSCCIPVIHCMHIISTVSGFLSSTILYRNRSNKTFWHL